MKAYSEPRSSSPKSPASGYCYEDAPAIVVAHEPFGRTLKGDNRPFVWKPANFLGHCKSKVSRALPGDVAGPPDRPGTHASAAQSYEENIKRQGPAGPPPLNAGMMSLSNGKKGATSYRALPKTSMCSGFLWLRSACSRVLGLASHSHYDRSVPPWGCLPRPNAIALFIGFSGGCQFLDAPRPNSGGTASIFR
jgi:hypothetical protein